MRAAFLAALAAALAAGGCTTALPFASRLDGTSWRVERIDQRATPRSEQYRVEFQDGRIGGRLGCNQFGGTYREAGDTLTVGPVAATEMACPEPHMTNEGLGFNILQRPMHMRWGEAGRLTLANEAGTIELARGY